VTEIADNYGVSVASGLPAGFDRLLRGAIDVHVHGRPDLTTRAENRGRDIDVVRLAQAYGLSGWVLKSHLWTTTDRANLLTEQLAGTGFTVWGSITLNPPVGGVSPTVVDLAAAHGAKVVFLPTWSSRADKARGGYIQELLRTLSPSFDRWHEDTAIDLLDGSGALAGATREVIDVCRERGLSLATGHASLAESRAIAAYCAEHGQRLLITHPLHYVERPQELREFAELGALVEFPGAPLVHPQAHLTVRQTYEAIEAVGPEHVVLTTDVFSRWVPPEPEMLRMYVEQLFFLGCSAEDLRTMLVANPRAFLGLPAADPE
jgi:sugar phosphate isomerase/epimerase